MSLGSTRIAAALLVLAFEGAQLAAAQPAAEPAGIAHLKDVKGNVLVSKRSGLAAGIEGMSLVEGTRVITTHGSQAVVVYDDGCRVSLKENQRFQVEKGRACAALASQPESILQTPEGATVTTAATGLGIYAVLLPVLGAAGVAELLKRREDRAVSPS
jgi:hypothetical protein